MENKISTLYGPVLCAVALITACILWIKWRQNYWTRRQIYQVKPDFFFGNVKDMFLRKKAFGETFHEIYKEIKLRGDRHGGFYTFMTPTYMPVDPIIIKRIMTKDFAYFMNHGVYFDEDREPLSGHIFSLEGQKWKNLRAKLTPIFTSGKMKNIYKTFLDCGEEMKKILISIETVDIRNILERYTIDVIGNCAFGINCNTLMHPDSEFRTFGKRIFERDLLTTMSRFATNLFPKSICRFLGIKLIHPDVSRFFMDIVKYTVEYREKHNFYRQDFMHLLLQLKNQGKVTDDKSLLAKSAPQKSVLSLNELAAQCFVFFLAGFETSATTMNFALFELALNQDMQNKLRAEIQTSFESNDKTYDAIMKMEYLEKIICETLRKYPVIPATTRICNTPYKIPDSNLILEKGSIVHIPIIGIHKDPDYYPDPDKFDPERFSDVTKASRPRSTWIPFGDGPRTCIGLRFGMLLSKIGIVTIVNNFRVSLNDKTRLPLEIDPYNFVYSTKGKIWLDIEKI